MGDNYRDRYPSQGGNQYYPPPPRDSYPQSGGYTARDNYTAQNQYAQPQVSASTRKADLPKLTSSKSGYDTYRPPTDEGYRASPVSPNMQVTQYDEDRNRNRHSGSYNSRHDRSRYDDDDRYSDRQYLDAPHSGSRPSSRGSHKEKRGMDRESEAKSIGATILGGVAGALIGRKAGNKDILPTVLGGVAGAWGGHKIEEEIEERRGKRSKSRTRRGEGDLAYEARGRRNSDEDDRRKSFSDKVKDRIRSLSRKGGDRDKERKRSDSRRRHDSESEDSDYDDRDRRGSGRRGRYGSESRDQYDGRDRYERY